MRAEGGRERRKGEKGKTRRTPHFLSLYCSKENGELGQVVDMDEVELLYACSAE